MVESLRPGGNGLLEVDVHLRLPGFQLDVDFAAGNKMIVLLGPSGAGKSLTLRSIAGIAVPDSGRIIVNGRSLFDSAARTFVAPQDRRVGYVPQDYALFPHLNVEANIAFGLRGFSKRERRDRAAEMVSLMGLRGLEKRLPHQLSGGQRQRVALARAMAFEPETLLLDEPFAALDAAIHRELREELLALQRRMGMTVVLVTHVPEDALILGEWLVMIEDGRVVKQGTPDELLQRPSAGRLAEPLGQAPDFRLTDIVSADMAVS